MAVKSIAEYIDKHPKWEKQLQTLRELLLSEGLEETIKWGGPVYMLNGKNLVSIGAFKNHYALWFFKGVLLKENTALLENTQEEKTHGMRQMRFQSNEPVDAEAIKHYIRETIQNEKDGKISKPAAKSGKIEISAALKEAFKAHDGLEAAFKKLSPGKQREYALYISEAKREATKRSRLEKITPMILDGAGLHDKYKK